MTVPLKEQTAYLHHAPLSPLLYPKGVHSLTLRCGSIQGGLFWRMRRWWDGSDRVRGEGSGGKRSAASAGVQWNGCRCSTRSTIHLLFMMEERASSAL